MKLDGQIALVTDAGGGIGKAVALAYGKAGADVVVNYTIDRAAAEDVCQQIESFGRRSMAIQTDSSRSDEVIDMINQTIDRFGRIDILVNNAGIQTEKAFHELTAEDWDKMIDVDLRGTFLMTVYAAQEMIKKKSGKILNITSVDQCTRKSNFTPYCSAKAAVGMLTKTLAAELSPHGIKINAIAPGFTAKAMNESILTNPKIKPIVIDEIPLNEVGTLEDVAALSVYLASDGANYVPGSTYVIDGGLLHQIQKH